MVCTLLVQDSTKWWPLVQAVFTYTSLTDLTRGNTFSYIHMYKIYIDVSLQSVDLLP